MRGVESQAMVMCASTPDKVEILDPPAGSMPGDRIICPSFIGIADPVLNPKKKVWETVAPDLKVSSTGVATYRGEPLIVDGGKGIVTAPTLRDVAIK